MGIVLRGQTILLGDLPEFGDQLANGMIRANLIETFVFADFSQFTFSFQIGNFPKDHLDEPHRK